MNALTLEKAKLVEELSETRRCLLDFNSLKDLLVCFPSSNTSHSQGGLVISIFRPTCRVRLTEKPWTKRMR